MPNAFAYGSIWIQGPFGFTGTRFFARICQTNFAGISTNFIRLWPNVASLNVHVLEISNFSLFFPFFVILFATALLALLLFICTSALLLPSVWATA